MKGVKPVPTPARLRWREFRVQVVPWCVYAGAMALAAMIWVKHVTPPHLVGQVALDQAHLNTTQAGRLVNVSATRFQRVQSGEALAQVVIADPSVIEGTLAVIRAEVALLKDQDDPVLGRERAQVDFERLRLNWLDQRVSLATTRVRLRYAESDVVRLESLRKETSAIVSQDQLELAVNNRDALTAEIAEREALVAEVESSMKRFQVSNIASAGESNRDPLEATLDLQESRLRLAEAQLRPIALLAPMDGVVSGVFRRSGENVAAGDVILTITATESDRILAYIIPPTGQEPEIGTPVEVIRRSARREMALATVKRVGGFMEVVPANSLALSGGSEITVGKEASAGSGPVQFGIPIELTLPPELRLRPGELVDLRWVPDGEPSVVTLN